MKALVLDREGALRYADVPNPRRPGPAWEVFGAGPIGNMAAQWMRLRGCSEVFVVDIDERKLALARSMGFSPIDPREGDPVYAIRARTSSIDAASLVSHAPSLAEGVDVFRRIVERKEFFNKVVFAL